jgi:uncharacterized protein (DUF433 family)
MEVFPGISMAYALSLKQVLDALAYAAHVAAQQAPAVREAS